MPLTEAQGLLLSNDFLFSHFIEDGQKVMQLAHVLPFFEVDGDTERWATTATLPNAVPIGFGTAVTEQTTVPVSRTYTFGHLATAREVYYATQERQSNVNDQAAVQLEMAARNLLYAFWRYFVLGNPANPGEFQGLDNILAQPAFAGQVIDLAGAPLTTAALDQAMRLIGTGEGYADAIYTGADGYNAIRQAFLTQGALPQHGATSTPAGKQLSTTHVDGVPVYWSDFVATAANKTTVYILKLGQRHVHGIIPASRGRNSMMTVHKTILTATSAFRYDMTFVAGVSVPSVKDIAALTNVGV